ncbi:tetratricopeptide repeat protein [Leptotrichia trevisanii]
MEILISVLIVVIGIVILIIMNFRNRKKMDEFDDFSREMQEREKRKRKVREIEKYEAEEKASFSESDYDENRISLESVPKQNEKTANIDKFGVKIVSLDDIVTEDYGKDFIEYDKKESEEYQENIRTANIFIMSGFFGETRDRIVESLKFSQRANYELGKYYYYCEKDNQSAVNALNLAYNSGIKETMYYIGLIEEESGNYEIAKGWYVAGAENGEINSIIRLGKIAEEKKDYEEAESIYLKIADTKNAELIYNLVRIYFKQNKREKILEWQEKLLNEKQIMGLNSEIIKNIEFMLGNEKDRKYVELINQGNELFEKRDKGNAQKRFLEAAQYNERGYLSLAKSYYVAGNGEKAKDMYEKAYSLGVKEAAYEMGKYFDIVEENEKEAEKWYKIGQEMGDAKSIYKLGILYECSKEFGKSEEETYTLYEKAANMKYAPAISDMIYYNDRQEDRNKLKDWAFKVLNETGLIELGREVIRNAQDFLEEMGEYTGDKILEKNYEIEYDDDLRYFIEKNSKGRNIKEETYERKKSNFWIIFGIVIFILRLIIKCSEY